MCLFAQRYAKYQIQPPAAYYRVFPRADNTQTNPQPAGTSGSHAASLKSKPSPSLISRFSLENRLENDESVPDEPEKAAGKGTWEDSKEKREASLRERKAQMILAARKSVFCGFLCFAACTDLLLRRMLAQQEKDKVADQTTGSSTGVSTIIS